MRLPRSPLQTRCLHTGVSLLLASQCFLGALPGLAEPVALEGAPAAVEQPASTLQAAMPPAAVAPPATASASALQGLMSLEDARQLGSLQMLGSLPSDEKVALRKVSEVNSQLKDKGALKILKSGQKYAESGADPETQMLDTAVLRQAEGRFTLLIDELAPTFAGGYANRANVRVALKDYAGAAADYESALRLSPLADDAWVNWLNRGSVLLAAGEAERALPDLQRAVELSKAAAAQGANQAERLTLLARGSALHSLGRYQQAVADYGAVVVKDPNKVDPFWLRRARRGQSALARSSPCWPPAAPAVCPLLHGSSASAGRGQVTGRPATGSAARASRLQNARHHRLWPPRYGLELYQLGQPQEALGYIRRVAAKFDIEPESQLALYFATASAGGERGATEALRLWTIAPSSVKEAAAGMDFDQRQWPPAAVEKAKAFLAVVTAVQ